MATTRQVTGTIWTPRGEPWEGFVVDFYLTPATATLTATLPSDTVSVATGADGTFSVELVVGVTYEVRLNGAFQVGRASTVYPAGTRYTISVPDGDGPISLETLRAAQITPPGASVVTLLQPIQAAVTTLQGDVATLQSGKADAADLTAVQSDVTTLQTDKADQATVDTALAAKADAADVTALTPGAGQVIVGGADGPAALSTILVASGESDAAPRINAALAAPVSSGGRRHVALIGSFAIGAPIIIRSNTILDCSRATITLNEGAACNMLNNAAVTDARTVMDATIAAATTALTSGTANFTAADVGQDVLVWGAGATGLPLRTTIVSVTDATTVVLADTATISVTNKCASIGPRDSAITVIMGTWDRGAAGGGTGITEHMLRLRRVDGIDIRAGIGRSGSGKYCITLGDVTDAVVDTITFDTWSDGVHLIGPLDNITVSHIGGETGDDMVSLTPNDWPQYGEIHGDVSRVVIDQVHAARTGIGAATGSVFAGLPVKILGGLDCLTTCVRVRGVTGRVPTAWGVVWVGDDTSYVNTANGLLDDVVIEDVQRIGPLTANDQKLVQLSGANIQRVAIRNLVMDTTTAIDGIVHVSGGAVASLTVEGVRCASIGVGSAVVRVLGATIGQLTIRDVTGNQLRYILALQNAATVTRCVITDITGLTGAGLVQTNAATQSLPRVEIGNVSWGSPTFGIGDIATSTDFHLSNVSSLATVAVLNLTNNAVVTVAGHNLAFNGKGIQGAGTVRSTSLGLPINVAQLARATGDMAFNINVSLACGLGPVVWNGTAWVNLATGATYTP